MRRRTVQEYDQKKFNQKNYYEMQQKRLKNHHENIQEGRGVLGLGLQRCGGKKKP